MNAKGSKEEQRLLEVLDAVQQQSGLSQRHLARHMGVALGLANSYLKRCIRKGFIKITSAPANRYLYYLTPKGFSEKSRLTAKYLSSSFEFYRRASQSCTAIFQECEKQNWRRIVLCGASDLAEIAMLRAFETNVMVTGVLDRNGARETFLNRPVWRALEDAGQFDCCVITDLQTPRETQRRLVTAIGHERVLVPDILGL